MIRTPVHPRLRGELNDMKRNRKNNRGSSPLTRGTPSLLRRRVRNPRFIPAYAGNSECGLPPRYRSSVHPRLRGELRLAGIRKLLLDGSSPLTRGTLDTFFFFVPTRRFIPAYAGNSRTMETRYTASAVHPRLRGELT